MVLDKISFAWIHLLLIVLLPPLLFQLTSSATPKQMCHSWEDTGDSTCNGVVLKSSQSLHWYQTRPTPSFIRVILSFCTASWGNCDCIPAVAPWLKMSEYVRQNCTFCTRSKNYVFYIYFFVNFFFFLKLCPMRSFFYFCVNIIVVGRQL